MKSFFIIMVMVPLINAYGRFQDGNNILWLREDVDIKDREAVLLAELYATETEIRGESKRACLGGNECCRPDNQCSLGEGDCDTDNDCMGPLVCNADCSNEVSIPTPNGNMVKYTLKGQFSGSDRCCALPNRVIASMRKEL